MIEKMNEKDFYKWFGKEFQITRERKGLKQKDVAEQAEVDPTELSRFENTGKKISAYKILRLLKAINSTAEEILGDTEEILGDTEKKNLRSRSMAISSPA